MMRFAVIAATAGLMLATSAQAQSTYWQPDPTQQQTYTPHRASSADPLGANADSRKVAPGATFTVLDADGPGTISHIWFTIADNEIYHLKRIVLRIYWDGETTPAWKHQSAISSAWGWAPITAGIPRCCRWAA